MNNKALGTAILVSIAAAVLGGILEYSLPDLSEVLYAIGGLGAMVFGIWGAIKLIK